LKIITFKHNPFKRLTIENLISSILFSQLNGRIIVFLGEINIFDILCIRNENLLRDYSLIKILTFTSEHSKILISLFLYLSVQ
jgi:hypothetical protein